MDWLYRLSSLARWYDLSLGYNRVIVLLSAVGGALGFVISWLGDPSLVAAIGRAAVAGLNVFGAAALAKEIDPDHPRSAVLAAAVAIAAAGVVRPESLPAILWLLLLLRFINRATGLAPKWTDTAALLLLAAWFLWRGGPLLPGLRFATPLFAVLTGAVLIVDALLPHGRRAHGPLGGVVVAGGLVYWAANAASFASTPHETWLTVVLLLITMATIGVILTCYVILMPGDATGRPLDSSRFQAAQIVALAVGLSFASWHGNAGATLFVALWAALVGAVITYWAIIGARRSPAST
jgi:hypothetical protein